MTDARKEFPKSWFAGAKPTERAAGQKKGALRPAVCMR
jgi:hypothetical protein